MRLAMSCVSSRAWRRRGDQLVADSRRAGPLAITIDNAVADAKEARPTATITAASAETPRALGLNMLTGAWWSDGARDVAVIGETTARRYFGGIDARSATASVCRKVIGWCRPASSVSPATWPTPIPRRHRRRASGCRSILRRGGLPIRARRPARRARHQVRTVVATQAQAVPIEYLKTFDAALDQAASSDYAIIGMLAGFAVLAWCSRVRGCSASSRTGSPSARRSSAPAWPSAPAPATWCGWSRGGCGDARDRPRDWPRRRHRRGSTMQSVLVGLSPTDPLTLGSVVALLSLVTLTGDGIAGVEGCADRSGDCASLGIGSIVIG